jgi:hypothetical protein
MFRLIQNLIILLENNLALNYLFTFIQKLDNENIINGHYYSEGAFSSRDSGVAMNFLEIILRLDINYSEAKFISISCGFQPIYDFGDKWYYKSELDVWDDSNDPGEYGLWSGDSDTKPDAIESNELPFKSTMFYISIGVDLW